MPHVDFPALQRRINRLGVVFSGIVLLAYAAFLIFLVASRTPGVDIGTVPIPPAGFILGLVLMIMVIAVNAVYMRLSSRHVNQLRDKITRDLSQ